MTIRMAKSYQVALLYKNAVEVPLNKIQKKHPVYIYLNFGKTTIPDVKILQTMAPISCGR